MSLPQGASCWSAVSDCGISWSYALTYYEIYRNQVNNLEICVVCSLTVQATFACLLVYSLIPQRSLSEIMTTPPWAAFRWWAESGPFVRNGSKPRFPNGIIHTENYPRLTVWQSATQQ